MLSNVVVIWGFGLRGILQHTSLAAPSYCTAKAVRDYFQDGILPQDGARCEPEVLPFDLPGKGAIPENINSDDQELVAASRELSRKAKWAIDEGKRAF